jgi:hypothetical protein
MDGGSFIFRNISANSNGVTLAAPAALASDYNLVLPQLPASTKIMALDSSGNMSAPYAVDNSSIEISSNTIQVKARGISNAMSANNVTSVTADYSVLVTDNVLLGAPASANITLTLPTAGSNRLEFTITKTTANVYRVILATTGGQTIGGIASLGIYLTVPGDSIRIRSDGSNYQILERRMMPVYGRRWASVDQGIANASQTLVTLGSSTGSGVTFSGNRINITYAGVYDISANLRYLSNSAGARFLFVTVNGTEIFGQSQPGVDAGGFDNYLSADISNLELAAGDAIELYTYQNSSGALNLHAAHPASVSLAVTRVGYLGDG